MHWVRCLLIVLYVSNVWAQESIEKPKSKVAIFEDASVVSRFQIDHQKAYAAFNLTLQMLTGKNTVAAAWKTMISPQDVVSIHITATGNPMTSTPPDVLRAVIDGLKQAGVKPSNIIVWDKFEEQLFASGYVPNEHLNDWKLRAVLPGDGFDDQKFYFNEIVGKLIWGDHEFVGTKQISFSDMAAKAVKDKNKIENESSKMAPDQISNRSHFAKAVTQGTTKIINLAVMSDHPVLGIYGACSSLAMASIDNNRRFLEEHMRGDPSVAEILAHDVFKDKIVLHVMTGFIAQYAGGPEFHPHYTQSAGILMMSRDPVAIDTLALGKMESWREAQNVPPIGDAARHLQTAARLGIGTNKKDRMEIILTK